MYKLVLCVCIITICILILSNGKTQKKKRIVPDQYEIFLGDLPRWLHRHAYNVSIKGQLKTETGGVPSYIVYNRSMLPPDLYEYIYNQKFVIPKGGPEEIIPDKNLTFEEARRIEMDEIFGTEPPDAWIKRGYNWTCDVCGMEFAIENDHLQHWAGHYITNVSAMPRINWTGVAIDNEEYREEVEREMVDYYYKVHRGEISTRSFTKTSYFYEPLPTPWTCAFCRVNFSALDRLQSHLDDHNDYEEYKLRNLTARFSSPTPNFNDDHFRKLYVRDYLNSLEEEEYSEARRILREASHSLNTEEIMERTKNLSINKRLLEFPIDSRGRTICFPRLKEMPSGDISENDIVYDDVYASDKEQEEFMRERRRKWEIEYLKRRKAQEKGNPEFATYSLDSDETSNETLSRNVTRRRKKYTPKAIYLRRKKRSATLGLLGKKKLRRVNSNKRKDKEFIYKQQLNKIVQRAREYMKKYNNTNYPTTTSLYERVQLYKIKEKFKKMQWYLHGFENYTIPADVDVNMISVTPHSTLRPLFYKRLAKRDLLRKEYFDYKRHKRHVDDLKALVASVETMVNELPVAEKQTAIRKRRHVNLDDINFEEIENLLKPLSNTKNNKVEPNDKPNPHIKDKSMHNEAKSKPELELKNVYKQIEDFKQFNGIQNKEQQDGRYEQQNYQGKLLFKRDIHNDLFKNIANLKENANKAVVNLEKAFNSNKKRVKRDIMKLNEIEFDDETNVRRVRRDVCDENVMNDLKMINERAAILFQVNENYYVDVEKCKFRRLYSGGQMHRKEEIGKDDDEVNGRIVDAKTREQRTNENVFDESNFKNVLDEHPKEKMKKVKSNIRNKRSLRDRHEIGLHERLLLKRMKREPRFRKPKDRLPTKKKRRTTCPFFARHRDMFNCSICELVWSLEGELHLHNYKHHNGSPQFISYRTVDIEDEYHTLELQQVEVNDTIENTRERFLKRCFAANQKRHRYINKGCTKRPAEEEGEGEGEDGQTARKKREVTEGVRKKREVRFEDEDGNPLPNPFGASMEGRVKEIAGRRRGKRDIVFSHESEEWENSLLRKHYNRQQGKTYLTKSWEWRIKNVNIRDYVYKILRAKKDRTTTEPYYDMYVMSRQRMQRDRGSLDDRIAKFYEDNGEFSGKTGSDLLDYFGDANLHDRHVKIIGQSGNEDSYFDKPKSEVFADEHKFYTNVKPGEKRTRNPHFRDFTDKKDYYDSSIEVAKSVFRLKRDVRVQEMETRAKVKAERKRLLKEHQEKKNPIRGRREVTSANSTTANTRRTFWIEKWVDEEFYGNTSEMSTKGKNKNRKRRDAKSSEEFQESVVDRYHVIDTHKSLFERFFPNESEYTPYTFYTPSKPWTSCWPGLTVPFITATFSNETLGGNTSESKNDLASSVVDSVQSELASQIRRHMTIDPKDYEEWCEWQRNRSLEEGHDYFTSTMYTCGFTGCSYNTSDEFAVDDHQMVAHYNLPTNFNEMTIGVKSTFLGWGRQTDLQYLFDRYSDEKKHPEIEEYYHEFAKEFDAAGFPTIDPTALPSRKRRSTTTSRPTTTRPMTVPISKKKKHDDLSGFTLDPDGPWGSLSDLTARYNEPTHPVHVDSHIKMEYSAEETNPPKYRCKYCGDLFHEEDHLVYHKSSQHPRKHTPTPTPCIRKLKKYFTLDSELDLSKNYDFAFSEPSNETFIQNRPILEDSFYRSFDMDAPENTVRNESYQEIEDYVHGVLNMTWTICNACGKNVTDDKMEAHLRKHLANVKKDYFDELPPEYMDRCYKNAHWNQSWETVHKELRRKYEIARIQDSDEFEIPVYKCKRCNESFTKHDKSYAHMNEHRKNQSRIMAQEAAIRSKLKREREEKRAMDIRLGKRTTGKYESNEYKSKGHGYRMKRSVDVIEVDVTYSDVSGNARGGNQSKANKHMKYKIYERVNNSSEKIENQTPQKIDTLFTVNNEQCRNGTDKKKEQDNEDYEIEIKTLKKDYGSKDNDGNVDRKGIDKDNDDKTLVNDTKIVKDDYAERSISEELEQTVQSRYYVSDEDSESDSGGISVNAISSQEVNGDGSRNIHDLYDEEDGSTDENGSIASDPDNRADDINTLRNGNVFRKNQRKGESRPLSLEDLIANIKHTYHTVFKSGPILHNNSVLLSKLEKLFRIEKNKKIIRRLKRFITSAEVVEKLKTKFNTTVRDKKGKPLLETDVSLLIKDFGIGADSNMTSRENSIQVKKFRECMRIIDAKETRSEQAYGIEYDSRLEYMRLRKAVEEHEISDENGTDDYSDYAYLKSDQWKCEECNETFVNYTAFLMHMKVPKDPKSPFLIDLEDKKRKATLEKFFKKESLFENKCQECGKEFATRRELIDHINEKGYDSLPHIHKLSQKIVCRHCDVKYSNVPKYLKHLAAVREAEEYVANKTNKFFCGDCKRLYRTHDEYLEHLNEKRAHDYEEMEKFVCKICNFTYLDSISLSVHTQKIHWNQTVYNAYFTTKHSRSKRSCSLNNVHRVHEIGKHFSYHVMKHMDAVRRRRRRKRNVQEQRGKRIVEGKKKIVYRDSENAKEHKIKKRHVKEEVNRLNVNRIVRDIRTIKDKQQLNDFGNIKSHKERRSINKNGVEINKHKINKRQINELNILKKDTNHENNELSNNHIEMHGKIGRSRQNLNDIIDKQNQLQNENQFKEYNQLGVAITNEKKRFKRDIGLQKNEDENDVQIDKVNTHNMNKNEPGLDRMKRGVDELMDIMDKEQEKYIMLKWNPDVNVKDPLLMNENYRQGILEGMVAEEKYKLLNQNGEKTEVREKNKYVDAERVRCQPGVEMFGTTFSYNQWPTIKYNILAPDSKHFVFQQPQTPHPARHNIIARRKKRSDDEMEQVVKVDFANTNTIKKINWEKLAKALVAENRNLSKLLDKHFTTRTTPIRKYECKVCGDRMPNLQAYVEHVLVHEKEAELQKSYPEEFNITCDHCYQVFSTEDAIHEHNIDRLRIFKEKMAEQYVKMNRTTRRRILTPFENPFTIPIMENADNTFWNPEVVETTPDPPDPREKYYCYYCKDLMIDTKEFVEHNRQHEVSRKQAKETYLKARKIFEEKIRKEFDISGSIVM